MNAKGCKLLFVSVASSRMDVEKRKFGKLDIVRRSVRANGFLSYVDPISRTSKFFYEISKCPNICELHLSNAERNLVV